jgi:hypothetical protein
MQAKMGAAWLNALRRFVVHLGHNPRFPVVLLAVNIDRDHLEWQGTFYENDFAIGSSGDALGLHIERIDMEPACWQIRTA